MIPHTYVSKTLLCVHPPQVVRGQAGKILGSVDFLGNPLGLISDVASGVSGMLAMQPDVVGLVRDVAHGVTDTTSKARRGLFLFVFKTHDCVCVCLFVCSSVPLMMTMTVCLHARHIRTRTHTCRYAAHFYSLVHCRHTVIVIINGTDEQTNTRTHTKEHTHKSHKINELASIL